MSQPERKHRQLRAISRPRPVRVAYLINPSTTSLDLVDAIFSACSHSWGGRLSPIVPVVDGRISPAYWQLLRMVDPDRIYSYTDLPQALLDRIMAEIDPLQIEKHSDHLLEGDRPYYDPSHNYQFISVVNVLSLLPAATWFRAPSLVTYNAENGAPPDRLIARNFGILQQNVLSEQLSKEIKHVTFDQTTDFMSFLQFVSAQREQLLFPYGAAASRAVVDTGDNWRGYTLFVGQDVADWVAFWNHIFTMRPALREDWRVLCVPPAELQQSRTIDALAQFLKRFANRDSGNPPPIDWVSSNHTEDELSKITAPLLPKHIYGYFRFFTRAEWSFPDIPERERYTFDFRGTEFGDPKLFGATLHQIPYTGGLVDLPSLPFRTRPDDRWMRDVRIEYLAEQPYQGNEDLKYQLPRRSGISRAFSVLPGRIDADGGLSFEMRSHAPLFLTIPNEWDLIVSAIGCGRRSGYDEKFQRKELRPGYESLSTSDKARYCRGVLNLCGGLPSAHRMFENRFWRRNLYKLSGARDRGSRHPNEVIQNIIKFKERWSIDPDATLEDEAKRIETEIIRLTQHVRIAANETTYEFLTEDFAKEREEFLELNPDFEPNSAVDLGDDVADFGHPLKVMMQEMTNAKIFQQGTIVRCSSCGSRNWHELSSLQQEFKCSGCGAAVHSEVEATWYYRLNTLMRGAIAHHGTVALVSALAKAREKAKRSFIFSPGISFFERYADRSPKVEVDAVCLVDGEVWVGEVKSAASEFKPKEMTKLVTEAKKLLADKAFVFALEGNQAALQRHCKAASKGSGIEIVQLYPSQFASQPTYYL